MLYDSKNRTFEAVLVYKLDRFAGSSYDSSVNRVVLFDDECYIYFNISDDKGTQLKLSEHQILNKKLNFGKKTTRTQVFGLLSLGGGLGIRTPGPSQVNGFQDRRFRPLSHSSIFI